MTTGLEWTKIVEVMGMLAGAMAAIFGFIKLIYRPIAAKLKEFFEFYKNCGYLVKEVRPNGGSSMRDSIEGLKHSIDAILATVIKLDQRQIAIAQHSEKGIFEADLNGDRIFVNRAYCRITGRSVEEVLGKGWKITIHPDERDKVVEEWYACIRERRDFLMAYHVLRPDRAIIKVDCHGYVLRDIKGTTIGYMGFITPIPEDNPGSLS